MLLALFLLLLPSLFTSSIFYSLSTRCLYILLRIKFSMRRNLRNKYTIPALFAQIVTKYPNKPALINETTGEVRTHCGLQINQPYCCQNLLRFHFGLIPGLDFQTAAGAMPCCSSLGAVAGLGWGLCGRFIHGKPAFSCCSLARSGYDWCRGCTHQLQPSAAVTTALCHRIWCPSNGVWNRDEGR